MMRFLTGFLFLGIVFAINANEEQKQEGVCSGQLVDGSQISFSYFSDYDGCQASIESSIKFSPESRWGFHEGRRTFVNNKDVYSFTAYGLTFDDSTGNTSGVFDYSDFQGHSKSITVQCVIQDFEYDECAGMISPN